ncbi:MAG TPA: universal stress protein [Vicinamibacterales bacterium]
MVKLERILCPVDLSSTSRRALAHAAVIARWYEARLIVLHVFNAAAPFPAAGAEFIGHTAPIPTPVSGDQVLEEVRRFVEPVVSGGPAPEIVVRDGQAVKQIVEQAGHLRADLLVIGTHGRSGFERFMLGSVTEKVVRKASCPVLTVPPAERADTEHAIFKTILCPVDFSPGTDRAVAYALSLAQEADARLILLHVVESSLDPVQARETAHFTVPEYDRYRREQAAEQLKVLVPANARDWCTPVEMVTSGKPHHEILRVAEQENAELIVMGVHSRGIVDLALFGSTTNAVIRSADCPVLTLRA